MSRSLTSLQAMLLGLVVIVGLGLAGLGVFAVGNGQWLWSDTFQVTVGFPQVRGVEPGTEVRIQGIKAGLVEAVEPPSSPGGKVILRLKLAGRLRHLLRSDASVQIVGEGMIGGKILEIDPGSASANPVVDNAQLASKPTAEITDVLAQVNTALDEIRQGQQARGFQGRSSQEIEAGLREGEDEYEQRMQALRLQTRPGPAAEPDDCPVCKIDLPELPRVRRGGAYTHRHSFRRPIRVAFAWARDPGALPPASGRCRFAALAAFILTHFQSRPPAPSNAFLD